MTFAIVLYIVKFKNATDTYVSDSSLSANEMKDICVSILTLAGQMYVQLATDLGL